MKNDWEIFENPGRNKFHLLLFEDGLIHWSDGGENFRSEVCLVTVPCYAQDTITSFSLLQSSIL